MIFDWDENKSAANLHKHGILLEDAVFVFADPYHVSVVDRIVDGEQRWQTIGLVGENHVVLVAHTVEFLTDEDCEDEYVRLISARIAEVHERRIYEENFQMETGYPFV